MSWLRLEGRMPHHRKVAPLSDAAFRLHVTAMAWCVEERMDGKIPKNIPPTLPACPRGRPLDAAIRELAKAGLWLLQEADEVWTIHDFLSYNPSAAQAAAIAAARSASGKAGGKRSAESKQATKQTLEQNGSKQQSKRLSKTEANFNPESETQSERSEDADLKPEPPDAPKPPPATAPTGAFPMHLAWSPSAEIVAAIEIAGVPAWAITELVGRFRGHFIPDKSDVSQESEWGQRCVKWVLKDWRNPTTRPKKPEPEAKPAENGGYGSAKEWA